MMTTGDIGEVTVDGKDIEVVTKFVFLGALITKDGLYVKEVRRRIAMGKTAIGGLTSIWKDIGVTLETKVKLVNFLVFPIVLCSAVLIALLFQTYTSPVPCHVAISTYRVCCRTPATSVMLFSTSVAAV